MNIFRFITEDYEMGEKSITKGFICGENYTDAVERLSKYFTDPNGVNQITELRLYETGSLDEDIFLDSDIEEVFNAEKELL